MRVFDKSERRDRALSRSDFAFDPEGQPLCLPRRQESWRRKYHRSFSKPRDGVTTEGTMIYSARKHDCQVCAQAQVLPERACTQDRGLHS